jgi:hypothetical protein
VIIVVIACFYAANATRKSGVRAASGKHFTTDPNDMVLQRIAI